MIRRAFAILLLAAVVDVAHAGFPSENFTSEWRILPQPATTRTPILLRNIVNACNPATGTEDITIDLATRTIDLFVFIGSDVCDDHLYIDDHRDTILGYLPAGSYTIRFFDCGNPLYYPEYLCFRSAAPDIVFGVAEAGRARHVIPAWSFTGAFATVMLLAGIALFRLRPR